MLAMPIRRCKCDPMSLSTNRIYNNKINAMLYYDVS